MCVLSLWCEASTLQDWKWFTVVLHLMLCCLQIIAVEISLQFHRQIVFYLWIWFIDSKMLIPWEAVCFLCHWNSFCNVLLQDARCRESKSRCCCCKSYAKGEGCDSDPPFLQDWREGHLIFQRFSNYRLGIGFAWSSQLHQLCCLWLCW